MPPRPAPATCPTRSRASAVKSTSSTSAVPGSNWARLEISVVWCPAAPSRETTLEPNSRSGRSATTEATPQLLRAQAPELLPYGSGAPPPQLRDDLDPAGTHLAHGELAPDPGIVEQL